MKKYMIMCMAAIALLFASCKNEDISISREVVFDVNPYEVIRNFVPNEYNTGDLELLPTGRKLRVQLLVYDEKGNRVGYDVRFLDDYLSTMNVSINLPDGKYTAVATSDVVRYNGGVTFEYWEFSGLEHLSDLTISDNTYYNTDGLKTLGAGSKTINVTAGQTSHHINMEPQGALIYELVRGIHLYEGVSSYELLMNKRPISVAFNSDGSTNQYVTDLSTMYWHICAFDPSDFSAYGGYGYEFLLPTGRTSFVWSTKWADGNTMDLTDVMSQTIEAGKMYQFVLDMGELTYYWGEMGDKSIPSFSGEPMTRMSSEATVMENNIEK